MTEENPNGFPIVYIASTASAAGESGCHKFRVTLLQRNSFIPARMGKYG